MNLFTPSLIAKEMIARDERWLSKPRREPMKPNSLEYRICRKSELSEFMGASIDDLIEEEARQSRARIAAEVIYSYVGRMRVSAGDISGGSR
jgi:hypothetical protein